MKKLLRNVLQILLFFGIGAGILWLVYRDQDAAWQAQCAIDGVAPEDCSLIRKIGDDFASARYFWLILVLLAFTVSNVSRTIRWRMLLRPLGYKTHPLNGFFTIMLGYFANLGFPRIGEVVRAGTFARYEKIEVEKVMGTVVVDRIADVISLALVMGLALIMEFDRVLELIRSFQDDPGGSTGGGSVLIWILAALAGAGLIALFLVILLWRKLKDRPLFVRLRQIAVGFLDGIKTIRKLDRPGWFIFHSANIWFMYFLMTYLGFFAFAPTEHLGLEAGLMVFTVGALGILIPSPGGMGTYHALVTACLVSMYGIAKADGFSFANILFFSIQLGCNILLGLLALVVLPIINRGRETGLTTEESPG